MMADIAKWSVLFIVMLLGYAGALRVLYSAPDAAHLLGDVPDYCSAEVSTNPNPSPNPNLNPNPNPNPNPNQASPRTAAWAAW